MKLEPSERTITLESLKHSTLTMNPSSMTNCAISFIFYRVFKYVYIYIQLDLEAKKLTVFQYQGTQKAEALDQLPGRHLRSERNEIRMEVQQ